MLKFLLERDIFPVLHAASFPSIFSFYIMLFHCCQPVTRMCWLRFVCVSLGVGPFLTLPVSVTSSKVASHNSSDFCPVSLRAINI